MSDPASNPITDLCPYCKHSMHVKSMECSRCHVAIEANFPTTRLGRLSTEHQRFIEMFVLASGSLKEIASQTGVSYPTVRARLDRIIDELRQRIDSSVQNEAQSGSVASSAARSALPKKFQQRS